VSRPPVLASAFTLAAVAVIGVALVAAMHELTAARIAANEREALVRKLTAILPEGVQTDTLLRNPLAVRDPALLGSAQTLVYRARRGAKTVALIVASVAPEGYGGPIDLLVAVLKDGTLGGVRVVKDSETPGLGDKIEATKSNWILGFAGKSLANPPLSKWKVKRDGGAFDQFTGATITPRAVVKAVRNTLIYVRQHHQALFSGPAAGQSERPARDFHGQETEAP
jgi:electron transport complex protein RnfG